MHAERLFSWIACGIMIMIGAACGTDSNTPAPLPSDTAPPTQPANATLSPALIRLQRDYEMLSESQNNISAVWEGLAHGEQIQCGDSLDTLQPENITGDGSTLDPLVAALRQAAVSINQAVELWQAECTNPRATIPTSVIDQGRLAVRSADDSLREAENLLGSIQG